MTSTITTLCIGFKGSVVGRKPKPLPFKEPFYKNNIRCILSELKLRNTFKLSSDQNLIFYFIFKRTKLISAILNKVGHIIMYVKYLMNFIYILVSWNGLERFFVFENGRLPHLKEFQLNMIM